VAGWLPHLIRLAILLVTYIFKSVARLLRVRGSGDWPLTRGTVATSRCEPEAALGCPASWIVYSFIVNGKWFSGMDERAFIFHRSAKTYAGQFLRGHSLAVRYKPADPWVSVVCDNDQ